jgi:hypothetical protein
MALGLTVYRFCRDDKKVELEQSFYILKKTKKSFKEGEKTQTHKSTIF